MAKKDVEKLISLICQGGEIAVRDGFLMVTPPAIANKFGDQIRKLKPEILLALGHCPVCAAELVVKVEESGIGKTGRHSYCSGQTPGHYDAWKF
jgi:hypothetical protein